MGEEYVKEGYKLKISRRRTQVTTYEDMKLHTTQPIKEDKPKKIKPSIPSNYKDFNYYNTKKRRRAKIHELCENNFEEPNVVMLTLTFDQERDKSKSYTDMKICHYEFKKFIQRVNTHYDGFKYIATFSRQTNGNWHYHVMCNFNSKMTNEEISDLWKNGFTYITYIKKRSEFEQAMKYLIDNMDSSANETVGKNGYLNSTNLESDIELKSWKAEDEEKFYDAFERVENNKRKILYETKNPLGIKGKQVNEETGEIVEIHIPDREINSMLENAGYEKWETTFTHLSSAADFSDMFSKPEAATLKPKKFKRNKDIKA